MQVELEKPYSEMPQKIIDFGFAEYPVETVKQSILSFSNQIEFEELYLVNKADEIEFADIKNNNVELIPMEEVF